MKKSILPVILIGLVFSINSCVKDYSCSCTLKHEQTATGYSETKEISKKITIKTKKSQASASCGDLDYSESYTDSGGISHKISQTCED